MAPQAPSPFLILYKTSKMFVKVNNIMLARRRRHLSMQDIADRATVSRLTVSKVEHGDPTVSMGIYARVLFALNLEKDLSLLAADDALGRQLQDAELLRK